MIEQIKQALIPRDEEYRWLADQWYINRRQRVLLLSNSRGKLRKKTVAITTAQ